jgi:cytochrome c-type biogenesis protein CcmH/NrfG
MAAHHTVILDFRKRRVVRVRPRNPDDERALAEILAIQREQVMTASGIGLPQQPR